jgi:hypothetical protein
MAVKKKFERFIVEWGFKVVKKQTTKQGIKMAF